LLANVLMQIGRTEPVERRNLLRRPGIVANVAVALQSIQIERHFAGRTFQETAGFLPHLVV